MTILLFAGEPAYTRFQLDKINRALAPATLTAARQCLLCEIEEPDSATIAALEPLLQARYLERLDLPAGARVIAPRRGTVSPWSSKATEIARGCGLHKVIRLERGRWLEMTEMPAAWPHVLLDRMTEEPYGSVQQLAALFEHAPPRPLTTLGVLDEGRVALERANRDASLALSEDEIDYLLAACQTSGRDLTDAELMMFAQANSEHCRHKIFRADWTVDGKPTARGLFDMIRVSHERSPAGVLTAYSDNAAVLEAGPAVRVIAGANRAWREATVDVGMMIKVETHNHPTAIAPYPGAATGSGGEIRDEAATGRGAKPKIGMAGFSVSDLHLPRRPRAWEGSPARPGRIASALDIMIEGPLGAAAFNNEFGRPALGGYFRTFEADDPRQPGLRRGYHKPIMIAGGMGVIDRENVRKGQLSPGDQVLVLGGPAMLIGLGGGAASSMASGHSAEALDFASVQRDNPEVQRRCQEVIDQAAALGAANPIISIHDVGAGGLSNAIPELLHDSGRGGELDMDRIPRADSGLSPMELWCNESQERYVLGIAAEHVDGFLALCRRERCPVAVVGTVTEREHLVVERPSQRDTPIDLAMQTLFGNPPQMHRHGRRVGPAGTPLELTAPLGEMIERVLTLPAVGSKKFLITIGDRTVGGLCARDQMVGPWQVPVADCAVALRDFRGVAGEAMAMGERTPLALLDGPASGRMAVGEALTNIAAAPIGELSRVKLSANWMAATGEPDEDAALFDTVRAVGEELCPALGIAIPVGKDSLSMRTVWGDDDGTHRMHAPLSLIVTAFAPALDVERALTPQLRPQPDDGLWLIDLGERRDRLGGSALAQVYGQLGQEVPDLDEPRALARFFAAIQQCVAAGSLLAYHDRSDGGVLACVLEMAFAGRCGVDLNLTGCADPIAALFAEELGAVVQVSADREAAFWATMERYGLADCVRPIATPRTDQVVRISAGGETLFESTRGELEQLWAQTSHEIQRMRDHPVCADEEFAAIIDDEDPGLGCTLTFSAAELHAPAVAEARPTVAILREQGVNGQVEMAAAFMAAGFDAVDVHMSDLLAGAETLDRFHGLAACGGFSYGDVLGAGRGWASSVLYDQRLRDAFAAYFERSDRFTLGVCNGCQMLSALGELIPGSDGWPHFGPNRSARFEARLALVEVLESPSVLLAGMAGSRIPVAVSHAEGRARFAGSKAPPALRYVDHYGRIATRYPANVNGSDEAATAVTSADGRVTLMMPHPERVFRSAQFSWRPPGWAFYSPWFKLFVNARQWVARA